MKLDEKENVALRRALLTIDDLLEEVEAKVRSIDRIDHERFLRHVPQIRTGLANLQLDSPAAQLQNLITEVALESLDLCAARLSEDYVEYSVEREDLDYLARQVDNLYEFVSKSEIEKELQTIALDLIESLRRAIAEYEIRGIDGLERTLEEMVGKLTLYYARHEGPVSEPTYRKILSLAIAVEGVIARALTYEPYLSKFVEMKLLDG